MNTTLYSTGINVRDLHEDLGFFTEALGLETVGGSSDQLGPETHAALSTKVLPALFGLEAGTTCEFRSQLVAPKGNHSALYELFEWISPQWTQVEPYEPSNHVGLFRSQMQVEGYDDVIARVSVHDRAEFMAADLRWQSAVPEGAELSFSRQGAIRHDSGAVIQIRQKLDDELSAVLPGRAVGVNHRAIHVKNIDESIGFYADTFDLSRQTAWNESGHSRISEEKDIDRRYVDYLTTYQLHELFGFDRAETPVVDLDAGMLTVAGVDGTPQNLDLFEWIAPRAFGDAYPTPTHLGLQRLCFVVDDFDTVRERLRARARAVVCDGVDLPALTLPGLEGATVTRAMSALDPNGVLLLVLG